MPSEGHALGHDRPTMPRYCRAYKLFRALIDTWQNTPILGGGFGHYAKNFVRQTFLYEVQWVVFLAKFGIIGFSFLLLLLFLLFYKILSGKKSLDHYVLAFALLWYILGGFTNPIIVNSTAAVIYVLPVITASKLREELIQSSQLETQEPRHT